MSTSDELNKLADLHARGVLSDEEFARAKARVLDGAPSGPGVADGGGTNAVNSLRRSRNDRWLGGVCGGIASATGLDSWIWRLAFTLGVMFAGGGIFVYLLLWIFVPED